MRLRLAALAVALTCVLAITAAAQSAPDLVLDARTREVAAQLRCPICQGLSVEDSPTELAQQMKTVIRTQLAEGRSPGEVKAYFVSKYGEWILLEPEPRGFNLAVYLLPLVALAAGAGVVVLGLRRWTRVAPEKARGEAEISSNREPPAG